jgi:hypothetical protein
LAAQLGQFAFRAVAVGDADEGVALVEGDDLDEGQVELGDSHGVMGWRQGSDLPASVGVG